ncbi:MAG: tetratricopeptide repeat protein, partial [Alphaproteobacteria bacterium]
MRRKILNFRRLFGLAGGLAGFAAAILVTPALAAEDKGKAAFERGDFANAFKEWQLLAARNDAGAEFGLGMMMLDGTGVKKNERHAVVWIQKAADHGLREAQFEIGVLYGIGRAVPQDYAEAEKWLKRSADKGDARAQSHLGYLYQKGLGVDQSDPEAFRLYHLAADQGLAEGQLNLGIMYATGTATLQDFVQAHMWFNLAAAQGDKAAAENRDQLARKMTKEQIENAQTLAVNWQPKSAIAKSSAPKSANVESAPKPESASADSGTKKNHAAEKTSVIT